MWYKLGILPGRNPREMWQFLVTPEPESLHAFIVALQLFSHVKREQTEEAQCKESIKETTCSKWIQNTSRFSNLSTLCVKFTPWTHGNIHQVGPIKFPIDWSLQLQVNVAYSCMTTPWLNMVIKITIKEIQITDNIVCLDCIEVS